MNTIVPVHIHPFDKGRLCREKEPEVHLHLQLPVGGYLKSFHAAWKLGLMDTNRLMVLTKMLTGGLICIETTRRASQSWLW
jgi:hypothetical protein